MAQRLELNWIGKYLFIPHDFITETTSFDAYLEHFIGEDG